jgi:hypothetical protein
MSAPSSSSPSPAFAADPALVSQTSRVNASALEPLLDIATGFAISRVPTQQQPMKQSPSSSAVSFSASSKISGAIPTSTTTTSHLMDVPSTLAVVAFPAISPVIHSNTTTGTQQVNQGSDVDNENGSSSRGGHVSNGAKLSDTQSNIAAATIASSNPDARTAKEEVVEDEQFRVTVLHHQHPIPTFRKLHEQFDLNRPPPNWLYDDTRIVTTEPASSVQVRHAYTCTRSKSL